LSQQKGRKWAGKSRYDLMSANCACYGSDLEASLWVADYMKNEILLASKNVKCHGLKDKCPTTLHSTTHLDHMEDRKWDDRSRYGGLLSANCSSYGSDLESSWHFLLTEAQKT
jgi:hypothetical protein